MNPTIRRDALCRRYPRAPRALELGTLVSIFLIAFSVACIARLG